MREPIEFPLLRSPRSLDWNDQNEREHIAKHGVRFRFAIGIFLDPLRIETIDMRHDYRELHYNGIGVMEGTCPQCDLHNARRNRVDYFSPPGKQKRAKGV